MIDAEIAAHMRSGIWGIVRRTAEMAMIGRKWVFALKRNEVGDIVRYRARLVALRYQQEFGVNFFETYAPVANVSYIRIMVAVAVELGMS